MAACDVNLDAYRRLRRPAYQPLRARGICPIFASEAITCGTFAAEDYEIAKDQAWFKYLNRNDLVFPIWSADLQLAGFRKVAWDFVNPTKWNKFRAQNYLDTRPLALWNGVTPQAGGDIFIFEGEADFGVGCEFVGLHGNNAMVLGVIGGHGLGVEWHKWLRDDCGVFIFTDLDDAGNRYAREIRESKYKHPAMFRYVGFSGENLDVNELQMKINLTKAPYDAIAQFIEPMEQPDATEMELRLAADEEIKKEKRRIKAERKSDPDKEKEWAFDRLERVCRLLAADYWIGNRRECLKCLTPVVASAKDGRIPHTLAKAMLLEAAKSGARDKETSRDRQMMVESLFRNTKIR